MIPPSDFKEGGKDARVVFIAAMLVAKQKKISSRSLHKNRS